MEQTIGKRIAEHRKRLGMTQDQLAEQLGVTAQAVSKWENDQSCPDIATLPRLAEIFSTTTDALLGRPEAQQVHTAEIVGSGEENEPDGIHVSKGNWNFQWDGGRRGAVAVALWVLLSGGLLLAKAFLQWNASFWDILWPTGLLVFGLSGLVHRISFWNLGCILFGGYFLADNLHLLPFHLEKNVLLPVFIILLGLNLLASALRRPKKPRFHIKGNHPRKAKKDFHMGEGGFIYDLSFGQATQVVNLDCLEEGEANCSFGELTVDLSGCQSVSPDCCIDANCSFGQLTFLVPRRFQAEPEHSTAFASLEITGQPHAEPAGILRLNADVSFGCIEVRYI